MLLLSVLLGALAVVSRCAVLKYPVLQCYKDAGGKVAYIKVEEAGEGKLRLPTFSILFNDNSEDVRSKFLENVVARKGREADGREARVFRSPVTFIRYVDARPPPTPLEPPERILSWPLPIDAQFSPEDSAIIHTLYVPQMSREIVFGRIKWRREGGPLLPRDSGPTSASSRFVFVNCNAGDNGKVTAFLAEQSPNGKFCLPRGNYPLPVLIKSKGMGSEDETVKRHMPELEKEPGIAKAEYIKSPAKTLKVVHHGALSAFEQGPYKAVPIPIPENIKFSEADLAVLYAVEPSIAPTSILVYAGIGAGVLVLVIAVVVGARYFRSKQSSFF